MRVVNLIELEKGVPDTVTVEFTLEEWTAFAWLHYDIMDYPAGLGGKSFNTDRLVDGIHDEMRQIEKMRERLSKLAQSMGVWAEAIQAQCPAEEE